LNGNDQATGVEGRTDAGRLSISGRSLGSLGHHDLVPYLTFGTRSQHAVRSRIVIVRIRETAELGHVQALELHLGADARIERIEFTTLNSAKVAPNAQTAHTLAPISWTRNC
jgi:hypothetical protein